MLGGGEAGETAEKSRHSSVNWVGAGVVWPGEVPGGNSVTVGYRFPLWSAFGGGLCDVYFVVEGQKTW